MDSMYYKQQDLFTNNDYEDEDDDSVELQDFSEIVLNSADWTTETIVSQLKRGNINLRPRFQRRDAWPVSRKSRFIESLILGLPIPQLVLAERRGQKGQYLILDGKQRLLSLLQFTGNAEGANNRFRLRGLELRKDLAGLSFENLGDDPNFSDVQNSLLNQTIRTVVIRNWSDTSFLHVVFLRLNTSTTPLSPQELRQALFPGSFANYIDDSAIESEALQLLLRNTEPDFRMRDIELLIRYLGFKYYIEQYSGNLRAFLDFVYQKLNATWDDRDRQVARDIEEYEKAIFSLAQVFGSKYVGRKWTATGFEPRLNRAVLDVQSYYFSHEYIRSRALERPDAVVEAFMYLCTERSEFRFAIETTTKSITATFTRFKLWSEVLADALGISVPTPTMDEGNRIIMAPVI